MLWRNAILPPARSSRNLFPHKERITSPKNGEQNVELYRKAAHVSQT